MIEIYERIDPLICQKMKEEIEGAYGNEVLFLGFTDSTSLITKVKPVARGGESSVPALMPHMSQADIIIHNHPSGDLRPSQADLYQASLLGNKGIGFYIVDSALSKINVIVEPIKIKELSKINLDNSTTLLKQGGALSRLTNSYEERPSQIELMSHIIEGFNEEQLVIAEAGTGVGKSLAYLIPALYWASENKQRVVVSTATINLQQQIMEKDFPLAQSMTKTDIKAVLVKGRRNYICFSRLQEALEEDSLFREENDPLNVIHQWADSSITGSLSDLNPQPEGALWAKVCSEGDACTGVKCHYYERCFVMKARREASSAGLLVVNHHLFFADLSLRSSGIGFEGVAVLPPFHKIIFDEAHNIENSATSYFSQEYSRPQLIRYLNRLYRQRKGRSTGLLLNIERVKRAPEEVLFSKLVQDLRLQTELFDNLAYEYHPEEFSCRILDPLDKDYQQKILSPLLGLKQALAALLDGLVKWYDLLNDSDKEHPRVIEFKLLINRLNTMSSFLDNYYNYELYDGQGIFWLEKKMQESGPVVRLVVTPLDISKWMKSGIYDSYGTVIFTSATLKVNKSFNFWKSRVGLLGFDQDRLSENSFDSPFDYKKRVLLGLPSHLPEPASPEYQNFLPKGIEQLIRINGGRGLILFTSYEMLKLSYNTILKEWNDPSISLLRQGMDDRSRLLKRFAKDQKSVLFATDSFWEGVDAPGDALTLVVLCRFPFKVPSDPVYQARLEAIEKRGGNSFRELSLPEAVMKFRQGFGRLMRRRSDWGTVVVLDSRILTKPYGSVFINSLPHTRSSTKSWASYLEEQKKFILSFDKNRSS